MGDPGAGGGREGKARGRLHAFMPFPMHHREAVLVPRVKRGRRVGGVGGVLASRFPGGRIARDVKQQGPPLVVVGLGVSVLAKTGHEAWKTRGVARCKPAGAWGRAETDKGGRPVVERVERKRVAAVNSLMEDP